MKLSWSLDGLEDRLKEHSEFIDSLLCLIPPKHYFKNDPNASDDEEKFQPNKKKRIPKQVINEQKKQAKKQKSQSDSDDDAESDEENDKNKIITESRKKDSPKIQPVPDRLARIIHSKRLADTTNTDSSKKDKRKKLQEFKKQQKKLKQKQSKINKEDGSQIKSEEKNINVHEDTNKEGVSKKVGDIKTGEDFKKTGEDIKKAGRDIKKSGSVKRKIGDDDIEEDSLQQKNGLQFAKFDFADGKKKKKKIDDVHLKVKLQDKIEKVKELKKKDPEKAADLQEKEAWDKAFLKAQGEKVKDDPKLLAKTIKKKVVKKKKSEKAWKDRIESVENSMAERQKTRTENIKARVDAKNKKNDEIIQDCMRELERGENTRNPFARIAEVLPQYKARQICHRYRNKIDSRICQDPLNESEKQFVIRWIETNQTSSGSGTIHWKSLVLELKIQCGILRSRNKLKNFWYSRKKHLLQTKIRTVSKRSAVISPSLSLSPILQPVLPDFMEPKFQPDFQLKEPKMEPLFN
ncbi:1665_t:CDS:10 [Funneliformis geosporum]|uniref:1665_t:CDS:1 n=1 Tax=Funneliformis geosporum TaxID=1117311 RepID=A0A9W4WHY9_9GLOM|nr:1665_t:CDS:10 [Funneliformis geosporum]